jgi:hypothetical protein
MPLSVALIANGFLLIGGIVLVISILVLLLGLILYLNRYENVPGAERFGLLSIALIMFGIPGIVLSVMTILPSFGLRKMRKWGLWCSYFTVTIWAIPYMGIQGSQFPVTSPFGLFSHFVALTIIAVEMYLTRIYWQYFTREK